MFLFGEQDLTVTWIEVPYLGAQVDKTVLWLVVGNLIQLIIIVWLLFKKRDSEQPPQP